MARGGPPAPPTEARWYPPHAVARASRTATYFTNLFSPETHAAFSRSDQTISGFRRTQQAAADRVGAGDRFVCYLTKVSRWIGLFEVVDGPFESGEQIFATHDDPFVVRFHVKPLVWLPVEQGIPVHDPQLWDHLSFTKGLAHSSAQWTGQVRKSLNRLKDSDGRVLEQALLAQAKTRTTYPLDDAESRRLRTLVVRRPEGPVAVTVPLGDSASGAPEAEKGPPRESIRMQALLGRVGATMGFRIWIPASDRAAVLSEWAEGATHLIEHLPLNYDETTLGTIENIDVLWIKGRSIARAFEVEHTTAVYSGILRMADLLALQPNMDIRLHIVAPDARKEKVFQEIRRPVFSLLDRFPLAKRCTFISYDSLRELAENTHLAHLSDSVLEEYEEEAE